ncbi:LRR protein [Hibiscus syriacus]|uniref:LRR protein n=1 Tax=Hibiscus syriacus TaxID=106335 RepID=A0A6A3CVN2_HIBSY|nr:uncharacterized protein LOC120125083 [Hibiscus syriacus]KAE8733370.1 LRR protein [Hibiscus syriacus]
MGKFIEEKALDQTFYAHHHDHNNDDHHRLGLNRYNSLEEKVSEFLNNDYADSDAADGYRSDENESNDSLQHDLYWESQEALLQEILERYALVGSKLRQVVNGIIKEARETVFCSCKNQKQNLRPDVGCINCLRKTVIHLLCRRGLNATLCVSKWKHTKNHPAGTHEYVEVIASTLGRKKQIPFVIELEFRDQFEIAKACDEYIKLVDKLPECYVGKSDYLNPIVGVMCDAAKRSMEEQKLHMGPWRKRSFVQMKWSNSSERRSLIEEPSRQMLHQFCSKSSKTTAAGIVTKRNIDTSC